MIGDYLWLIMNIKVTYSNYAGRRRHLGTVAVAGQIRLIIKTAARDELEHCSFRIRTLRQFA